MIYTRSSLPSHIYTTCVFLGQHDAPPLREHRGYTIEVPAGDDGNAAVEYLGVLACLLWQPLEGVTVALNFVAYKSLPHGRNVNAAMARAELFDGVGGIESNEQCGANIFMGSMYITQNKIVDAILSA